MEIAVQILVAQSVFVHFFIKIAVEFFFFF